MKGREARRSTAVGQCCGDCNGNGKVAINELVSAVNRALTGCQDDGICNVGGQALPATGQATSYGPGSDGDVRAGATLSYTDNGDGTITDNNTGLVWEKKDASGGIHDQNNLYTWGMKDTPYTMNGTMVTEFLASLNTPRCFAGHCDWRIPNVTELQSIVDHGAGVMPTVVPAFNTACRRPCTVRTCSCTIANGYWSSTTFQFEPSRAWNVSFGAENCLFGPPKDVTENARAVRGGL